jgi:hypothetical protein
MNRTSAQTSCPDPTSHLIKKGYQYSDSHHLIEHVLVVCLSLPDQPYFATMPSYTNHIGAIFLRSQTVPKTDERAAPTRRLKKRGDFVSEFKHNTPLKSQRTHTPLNIP